MYDFPRPSPHLLNISKVIELGGAMSVPIVVFRTHKGMEIVEEARLMRMFDVGYIVAGDQNVEDHLKYMEKLAGMSGAILKEPLWGADPWKILEEELGLLSFIIIGAKKSFSQLTCMNVNKKLKDIIIEKINQLNVDPLGEAGEYHSLVTGIYSLNVNVKMKCKEIRTYDDYTIALIE